MSTGGKTLYKAISSMIDPAGCSSKEHSVAYEMNSIFELYIYNIGLIFYQCFYNDLDEWLIWISIDDNFLSNKKFSLVVLEKITGKQHVITVTGGGNSTFSAQKVCNFLKKNFTEFTKAHKNFPANNNLIRGYQLVMKGYGDFGQLFWTTFLYYISTTSALLEHFYK